MIRNTLKQQGYSDEFIAAVEQMAGEVRIPCEVYTRCVGYFRPVSQMNPGKREEVDGRAMLTMSSVTKLSEMEVPNV